VLEAAEPAAPPLAGGERCSMPVRERVGRSRKTSHPDAPFLLTHMGRWVHTLRWRARSPQQQQPPGRSSPPLTWPGNAHNHRRETARLSNHTRRQSPPHIYVPRTLGALRSPGTSRHARSVTAPSIRAATVARDWAIGSRHGQIRARMCRLPHLPHEARIPDHRLISTFPSVV